jgi:hypothetical protein
MLERVALFMTLSQGVCVWRVLLQSVDSCGD